MIKNIFNCKYAKSTCTLILTALSINAAKINAQCSPGWQGDVLLDCDSFKNWSVEHDSPSSGTVVLDDGVIGKAIRLNWSLGDGDWVQAKHIFPAPIDLSRNDIFGMSLRGSAGAANRVSIMFADSRGVFYGLDCDDINQVNRWMINVSFPKSMFYHFFTIPDIGQGNEIDWSQIDRFFLVLKRHSKGAGGGSGHLSIDFVQADRAADWSRQQQFDAVAGNDAAKTKAVNYIKSQQQDNGLLVSWKEEPSPKSWLYDQALALFVFTRDGVWQNSIAENESARQAALLANFLTKHQ